MRWMLAWVLSTASLVGCGARTGVLLGEEGDVAPPFDVSVRDAPDAPPAAADAPADTWVPPDVPEIRCPEVSGPGFTLAPATSIRLGLGERVAGVVVAGDADHAYLGYLVSEPSGPVREGVLLELDALGGSPREVGRFAGSFVQIQARVVDGTLWVIALNDGTPQRFQTFRRAPGGRLEVLTPTTVFNSPATFLERPVVMDGMVLVATARLYQTHVQPVAVTDDYVPWVDLDPVLGLGLDLDPTDGVLRLLHGAPPVGPTWRVESLRDGSVTAAPVELMLGEGRRPVAFAVGPTEPRFIVVSRDELAGGLVVARLRADGSPGGAFSALWGFPGPPSYHLSAEPPPGHRDGYGLIATTNFGTGIFHGAGEDFVGDARDLPAVCEGFYSSLSPSPCGYLIACARETEILPLVAMAPPPR